jgi:16S rRNA (cytosine1402-N4)-methyltransferase
MPDTARWDSAYHAPVMAAEVVESLSGRTRALDGTLGGGGHSLALLEGGATVTGIDRDPAAIAAARQRLSRYESDGRFQALLGNYASLELVPELAGRRFDAILLDLGISSHQIDDLARGFSFRESAPLDMRMGADAAASAATLLNDADERELQRVFREYGDEPRAARLASEVVRRRGNRPLVTSDDLVGAIRGALGPRSGPAEFARLFQAVRIAVNDELAGLAAALPALRDRLEPGGRLAVMSYHSGEDRLVKHAFRDWSVDCVCPPLMPRCECDARALGSVVTRKAITASSSEVARNPRARSAKLRIWQSAG